MFKLLNKLCFIGVLCMAATPVFARVCFLPDSKDCGMGKPSEPPVCTTCCQYNSQEAAEAKIKDKTCEKAYQNDNKLCWYIKCDTDLNHSNGIYGSISECKTAAKNAQVNSKCLVCGNCYKLVADPTCKDKGYISKTTGCGKEYLGFKDNGETGSDGVCGTCEKLACSQMGGLQTAANCKTGETFVLGDKVDGYSNKCGICETNSEPTTITFKFKYTCNGGTCPSDVTGKIKYMFYGNGTGSNVNNNISGTVIPKTLWNNFESIGKELLWGLSENLVDSTNPYTCTKAGDDCGRKNADTGKYDNDACNVAGVETYELKYHDFDFDKEDSVFVSDADVAIHLLKDESTGEDFFMPNAEYFVADTECAKDAADDAERKSCMIEKAKAAGYTVVNSEATLQIPLKGGEQCGSESPSSTNKEVHISIDWEYVDGIVDGTTGHCLKLISDQPVKEDITVFYEGDVDCWRIDDHLGEGYEDNGSYQFQGSATISSGSSSGVGSCWKEYSGACGGPGACNCTMYNFSIQKPSWNGQAKPNDDGNTYYYDWYD